MGRGLSLLVARAPVLWPLVRGSTQRFWDRMAGGWDERREPYSEERLAPLTAACERLEIVPTRILELGTGTGTGARMLAERFPSAEVVAVDLSEAMVHQAEATIPEDLAPRIRFAVAVADAAALPFDDGSFELVAQLNLPAYFDEAARVLASGGYVIVASTHGRATPYYTPERVLRRAFARRGLEPLESAAAGSGTYFLARR